MWPSVHRRRDDWSSVGTDRSALDRLLRLPDEAGDIGQVGFKDSELGLQVRSSLQSLGQLQHDKPDLNPRPGTGNELDKWRDHIDDAFDRGKVDSSHRNYSLCWGCGGHDN